MKRKNQRKAKVGGILPPKGDIFSFVHEPFLILSSKRSFSDGKAKNECGTRGSLHLLEGEGDRVAVEGVKPLRKLTKK